MMSELATISAPLDFFNETFDGLKCWAQQRDSVFEKIVRPLATMSLHLLCAALLAPALIIYELALSIFKSIYGLFILNLDLEVEALNHFYIALETPGVMLKHLFAAILPWVAYIDCMKWNENPRLQEEPSIQPIESTEEEVKAMRHVVDQWTTQPAPLTQEDLLKLLQENP